MTSCGLCWLNDFQNAVHVAVRAVIHVAESVQAVVDLDEVAEEVEEVEEVEEAVIAVVAADLGAPMADVVSTEVAVLLDLRFQTKKIVVVYNYLLVAPTV